MNNLWRIAYLIEALLCGVGYFSTKDRLFYVGALILFAGLSIREAIVHMEDKDESSN